MCIFEGVEAQRKTGCPVLFPITEAVRYSLRADYLGEIHMHIYCSITQPRDRHGKPCLKQLMVSISTALLSAPYLPALQDGDHRENPDEKDDS